MSRGPRIAVAGLALSALAFVSLVRDESYTDQAVIPLPGDRPTLGFGSTTHADGSPVQIGDTTTPPKALDRAMQDVGQFEGALRQCVHVPLHQHEYDSYVRFSYNVGSRAFCSSTLVRLLNAGDYAGACAQMDRWTHFRGRDCRIRANRCWGLVTRRAAERAACEGRTG